VARTHAFLREQDAAIRRAVADLPPGRDLTTLPLFVLANLARGSTSLLPATDVRHPGQVNGAALVDQMRDQDATTLMASPAVVERMVSSGRPSPPALRDVFTGGGPVFPRLVDQTRQWAPGARFHGVYGSSEAEPMAELLGKDLTPDALRTTAAGGGLLAGHPVEDLDIAILRPGATFGDPLTQREFQTQCMAADQPGEIVVTGKHVLPGYLDGLGDPETKLHVAGRVWHRTGDGGRIDAKGRLWLLGRMNGRIADARGEIWPLAVEAAALSLADVRRAALVEVGGRRVLAIEGEAGADDVRRGLGWAQLDDVRIVSQIPMDRRHNSKVDLAALRAMLD
jgi:acyl-CoA synthetase (AMP-forming)/AMP-acid ligase II